MFFIRTLLISVFLFAGVGSGGAVVSTRVGLSNHQGQKITAYDFHFLDESGKAVRLTDYFQKGKPVLLIPVYFGCPGLCTGTLTGLFSALRRVNASAGRGFELVVFSIDSEEQPELALAKKVNYLKEYMRPETAAGLHFLTGRESEIKKLTGALGFRFEKDPANGVISHSAAVYVLSSDGVLSQTLAGSQYTRRQLLGALFGASHGLVARWIENIREFCFNAKSA